MYKRIIISVVFSTLIILIILGIASYFTVNDTIRRSLDRRVQIARVIAGEADAVLVANFNRLYDISLAGDIDLNDSDWEPEKRALQTAYQYSIFTDGIFLLDRRGTLLFSYPPRPEVSSRFHGLPETGRIISDGRPVVTDVATLGEGRKKVIVALVPLKNRDGEIVGVAGGEINPTNHALNQLVSAVQIESGVTVQLVDSNGVVLASNNPSLLFTGSDHDRFINSRIRNKETAVRRCHRCHEGKAGSGSAGTRSSEILAFAPLEMAPWGVSILQAEQDVFAPATKLKRIFLGASTIAICISLLIGIGMGRSIVRPVHELIDATHSIASGDMHRSVSFGGVDEIGQLSSSFEVMRVKLADSLEELHRYNIELEQRVQERTRELRSGKQKISTLLKKVINAQEDERKRIAREIHDETMQALSALLLKIELCRMSEGRPPEKLIQEMQEILVRTLDGLRTIMQNLRPSILDDLGLEAAVRWLLDKQLADRGIEYYLTIIGLRENRRFDMHVETTVFRIIQEAVTNIARHADASHVVVVIKADDRSVRADIEDDGPGFDTKAVLKRSEDGRGLGLLGMKERAHLLDGELRICSLPGEGTRISLIIPLEPTET
ncbi:MAG: hypothetical protein OHK006_04150 [Thermodesulfovibrionales bacterium]